MALRLRGSTSGYAEIDAPAVAGDVTLTLPSTTGTINVKDASGNTNVGTGVTFGNPSANIFTINNTGGERLRIAADGTVSIPGALNVSGVLTYEDVTSVDAIGLSTFRDGLNTKDVGITTISTSVSDTAVDVFIYDTSKDSDGGEWRKRTSHTSWYNETLNTATRGSRKEFPAVAVIVAETNQVTIYDGDDPDLPMWMVFNGIIANYSTEMLWTDDGHVAIYALNGQLWNGRAYVSFISDSGGYYYTNNRAVYIMGIDKRNGGNSIIQFTDAYIINRYVNDIAMTVLPNAPIDSATGLPVPTIAVATDGGLSVIKDDGTVIDLSDNLGVSREFRTVMINGEDVTGFNWQNGTIQRFFNALALSADSSLDMKYNYTIGGGGGSTENISATLKNTSSSDILLEKGSTVKDFYAATTDGLSMYNDGEDRTFTENTFSITDSSVAYATTSYNTGWMHGDIKGAFLSDTDATNVTGTELVTNGDFSSALGSTWIAESGGTTIAINSGVLEVTRSNSPTSGAMSAYQEVTGLEVGSVYVLTGEVTALSHLASIGVGINTSSTGYNPNSNDEGHYLSNDWTLSNGINAVGTMTLTFRAAQTTYYIGLGARSSATATASFDNISLRKAELDRSVNQKGLQVFGTVTKSAVATGAELVAYSGFSASNYLEQPPNSDIYGFGAGDFSITFWTNFSTSASYKSIITVSDGTAGGWGIRLGSNTPTPVWQFWDTNTVRLNSVNGINGWQQVAFVRSGTSLFGYVNGKLINSKAAYSTDLSSLSAISSSSTLRIGSGGNSGTSLTLGDYGDNIALLRLSASAPSAEQIKKMYEDEKVLFQENAKATLYGSSDAVTALAYDEITDQLHVGTSSGRSDFQGLRRINNTTTAVTTAISAHDSFIIEQ